MKITRSQEWLHLIAFFVCGVLVFCLLYLFAIRFIPPAEDVRDYYAGVVVFVEEAGFQEPAATTNAPIVATAFPGMPVLELNEEKRVGGLILVYRGLEAGGRFRLDVRVPEMDRQSVYRRVFEISEARDGFRIADRRFTLVSARETFLHLKLVD
jgi:hypothetical protein